MSRRLSTDASVSSMPPSESNRVHLLKPYTPPEWAVGRLKAPTHRFEIARLPTPIEEICLPGLQESGVETRIMLKRDDMTGGIELTGNKTRKLEFLIADALHRHCDIIVTTGGQQSNHCRATAAAALRAGIPTMMTHRDDGHGENGNFFLNGLLGAKQTVVRKEEWARNGGHGYYLRKGCDDAAALGRKPCAIPCGGSNSIGVWGYIQACEELRKQGALDGVSHIVCASGSGGTVAGLGIGVALMKAAGLANPELKVLSYCVCDTPDEFYDTVDNLVGQIALTEDLRAQLAARNIVTVKDAVGQGYGQTTSDERAFLVTVARTAGVIFDRTYTNKALFAMTRDLCSGDLEPHGSVLFIHTGGAPSVFDHHDILDLGHYSTAPSTEAPSE